MMKRVLVTAIITILLLTLLVTGTGFVKITGGGWFVDSYTGNRITIGFTGIPVNPYDAEPYENTEAKGQCQLIDHVTKDRIHIDFSMTMEHDKPWKSFYAGTASLNGEEGYIGALEFHNDVDYGDMGSGDMISIIILDAENPDFNNPVRKYMGFLVEGDAQQH